MKSSLPTFEATVQILVSFKRPQSGEEIPAWHFENMAISISEPLTLVMGIRLL